MVVQQEATLTETRHGGTAAQPTSLVEVAGSGEHYWVGDAIVEGGTVKVLYTTFETTGGGPFDLALTGTSLATFDASTLQRTGLQKLPVGSSTGWGSSILEDGSYTYIYGTESAGDMKFAKVARASRGDIGGAWEFWTGTGWSAQESAAARLLSGVGTLYSVENVDGTYVLVTHDTNIAFSKSVVAHIATSPTGPFGDPIYLFEAAANYPGKPIVYYDAKVHRELSPAGRLVVSYNVNSLDNADNFADARIYRPRFVDVPVPLPGPCTVGAPGAPTNLAAANRSDGTVRLTWTAPAGTGLKYRIYQRNVTAGQTHFARLSPPDTASTSTDLAFLKTGATYEFRVAAVNPTCEGPASTVARLAVDLPVPPPPSDLTAAAGLDGEIQLEWTAAPAVVYYAVYMRDVTAEETDFKEVPHPRSGETNLTVNSLQHDHKYEFQVTAKHGGGESVPSNVASAIAKHRPPGAPTNLTASSNADGTITLNWTPPQSNEPLWYWIYQKDVTANETEFTKLPYPVTSGPSFTAGLLIDEHTYHFFVTAINSATEGPPSNVVQATSNIPAPPAPTNLRATPGNGEVTLSWTAPGTDLWYWIYQKDVTAGETQFTRLPLPLADGGTTATPGLLRNGHVYDFFVTALGAGGESPPSNVVAVTPQAPRPAAPTVSASANGDATVRLTWNAVAPDLLYWIYQKDVTAGASQFTRLPYPVDGTTFTAGLLYANHTYDFYVSAVDAGVEGPGSQPVRVTTRVDPPSNLSATPLEGGNARLSWTGPGEDVSYWVYQKDLTAGQTTFTRLPIPITGSTMTAGYLIGAHVYDFYVTTAVGGGESGPSNVVRITARGGTPPSAPTLSATAGDARVTLSWTDTGDYFWIYKRCVSCGETTFTRLTYPTNATSFVDTFVGNGSTYEYRVSATNPSGESPLSNAVRARPLPPLPGAPTGLTATPGDGKVTLRWTAPAGSNLLYVIYQRDVTAGQASFTKLPLPISGTSMTAGYLANGHRYEFYVRASNLAGEGPKSATVAATPTPARPTAPTNLSVTYPGPYSARLSWSPSTPSNVFYLIYMRDVSLGQGFRRMYYPVAGTSVVVEPLQRGHRYEFYVTADNFAGESGQSNHVFVNLGPQDGTNACTSVASSYRNLYGGGAAQFNYPKSQVCGYRHGDQVYVSMSWTSSGHHLYDGIFWYMLIDCDTGQEVWRFNLSYPNNPSNTSGSAWTWVNINSAHRYKVRTAGGGHVDESPSNMYILTFGTAVPAGIIPFDTTSGCF